MSTTQHRIGDYLQYELYHLLGAYGVAERRLAALQRRLERSYDERNPKHGVEDGGERDELLRLIRISRRYNEQLGSSRHAAGDVRHPIPEKLPLSLPERFSFEATGRGVEDARRNPWAAPMTWAWVSRFYDTAIFALDHAQSGATLDDPHDQAIVAQLAENLVCRRYLSSGKEADDTERRDRRLKRYVERRAAAERALPGRVDADAAVMSDGHEEGRRGTDAHVPRSPHEFLHRIATDNLDSGGAGAGSLPLFVISAQAEAHLSMHGVEAWRSMRLDSHASLAAHRDDWLEEEIGRSIVLSTFAYCVSRSAPWIFAEDAKECRTVFERCPEAWQNVVPTRCMWIASQVSLLALHRRAYARSLIRDAEGAYNDYHKLQRLIRDSRRRIRSAPVHVDGALEFLAGLDAQAHHHIGELYRSKHAHKPAGNHFRAASHELERLAEDVEMKEVLTNSRWHVQLHVSHGKTKYEMGRVKESLCWHLRGWKGFLELLAADTETQTNTEEIDKAIDWLTDVLFEPELLKTDVQRYLTPVIDQMKRISVDDRLAALAADILLRLGHLLFVLNLGLDGDSCEPAETPGDKFPGEIEAARRIEQSLAFPCLQKAAQCDNRSTLIGADLLKARFRFRSWFGGKLHPAYDTLLMPTELEEVAKQWPRGGDDYERLARVTEYLILRAQLHKSIPLPENGGTTISMLPEAENAAIAGEVLLNFFMHTDSINVRKSQAHRFLMKPENMDELPDASQRPAIEFICMRRYSSAFPLLPRPSAFRALGGGYFVRLHATRGEGHEPQAPFGIVVDPGVDFIENLYRTGFAVSDVDMIVVTHDHVDHLGSLDPLLSLLHEQSQLREDENDPNGGKDWPTIFVSESVKQRYADVTKVGGGDFLLLSDLTVDRQVDGAVPGLPAGFEIVAMSTADIDGQGHEDLSNCPSYGLCIRAVDGPSLAIAGDTPPPPERGTRQYDVWQASWGESLRADAMVAHLSTIPLTELRQMTSLDAAAQPVENEARQDVERIAEELRDYARSLPAQRMDGLATHVSSIADGCDSIAKSAGPGVTDSDLSDMTDDLDGRANGLKKALKHTKGEFDARPSVEALLNRTRAFVERLEKMPIYRNQLHDIRDQLEAAHPRLRSQLEFAFWLRSADDETVARLVKKVSNWKPPRYHSYLGGTLAWAREYRLARERERDGLFVIGELSEELGTARGKVAGRLNETIFRSGDSDASGRLRAITSDIGLHVLLEPRDGGGTETSILCTTCNLDEDRVSDERFHAAHEIREVCVKGENEGIFYNCEEHNPSTQEEPIFLEQLERFDIFGR
ncbi:MAG TPA: MBL fold metallo-hydrolase [Thermoleophilaceae bacterium]|nr:MBL fold metallo-hydrolase [Thermoleophilaceae bacterium]